MLWDKEVSLRFGVGSVYAKPDGKWKKSCEYFKSRKYHSLHLLDISDKQYLNSIGVELPHCSVCSSLVGRDKASSSPDAYDPYKVLTEHNVFTYFDFFSSGLNNIS